MPFARLRRRFHPPWFPLPRRRRTAAHLGDGMFTCAPDDQSGPRSAACLCHTPAFARLNRRLADKFSPRPGVSATFGAFAAGSGSASTRASTGSDAPVAFTNVRVFDGKSNALRSGLCVVVKGNIIKTVGPAEGALDANVRIVDCGGRVLMPGLIDAHWHAMMAALPLNVLMTADVGYINLVAAEEAEKNADARIHQRSRHGRPDLRAEARDRRGHCRGPAHLAVRRDDFSDGRPWRLPIPLRNSRGAQCAAEPRRRDRGRGHRRRSRSRPHARSRAADARREPAQTRRRRRRILKLRSDRRKPIYRGRVPRRRRRRRELGHLCRGARLYAARDQGGDPRRRPMHRTRAPDGRGDRATDRRQRHLAQHAAVSQQRIRQPATHGRRRRQKRSKSTRERTPPIASRSNTS